MPATVRQRGVLKVSTNRVRTSTALQGNSMWENVIGITNEQAGSNSGVEALINAPTVGGGRKATQARRQAAAEAVLATGGFDTSITNYQSLLAIAKQQGAVGTGSRGACKVCGQTGHLTKQCRNALPGADGAAADGAGAELALPAGGEGGAAPAGADVSDDDSLGFSDSSDEERRKKKKRRKEKRRSKDKKKSSKEKKRKHKSSSKEKKRKHKSKDRRRRSSSSSSSSSSGSDSD